MAVEHFGTPLRNDVRIVYWRLNVCGLKPLPTTMQRKNDYRPSKRINVWQLLNASGDDTADIGRCRGRRN